MKKQDITTMFHEFNKYKKDPRYQELLKNIQTAVIDSLNAEIIYYFTLIIKDNIDIDLLENAITNTKDAKYIYFFTKDIPNADINKLEEAIITTKNPEYIYSFIVNINNCNKDRLEEELISLNYAEYIYKIALHEQYYNKEKSSYKSTITRLENAIIESENPQYVCLFALNIKGCNITRLEEVLLFLKHPEYIYEIALYEQLILDTDTFVTQHLDKLQKAIIESNNPFYMLLFARDIKSSNKDLLEQAILNTKNEEYITYYNKLIKNIDVSFPEDKPKENKTISFPNQNQSSKDEILICYNNIQKNLTRIKK